MNVTFGGKPLTLPGTQLGEGDKLPDFVVAANDLSLVALTDTSGLRVFLSVPSLDTPVCDLEVRTFNEKAGAIPGVTVYAVSKDLPFAQARWCGATGVEAVKTLSDYRDSSFGEATGTLIEELKLLARAVFVVDADGVVKYAEYVPEVASQPNFDAVVAKLQELS
ncbi:MAG: thiol peroxidase [Clostridiales Family XIII bacterium]|nr:thiol peroxidase [Clostridiales Family XIII bacterium]